MVVVVAAAFYLHFLNRLPKAKLLLTNTDTRCSIQRREREREKGSILSYIKPLVVAKYHLDYTQNDFFFLFLFFCFDGLFYAPVMLKIITFDDFCDDI